MCNNASNKGIGNFPLRREPIAVCDRRTVSRGDMVWGPFPQYATGSSSERFPLIDAHLYTGAFSPNHQW